MIFTILQKARVLTAALLVLASLIIVGLAHSASITLPDKPVKGSFIADHAEIISAADEAYINNLARTLYKEQRVPIIIVTVKSLSDYNAGGATTAWYAQHVFKAWEIGAKHRNYGILLFIAEQDRELRIELGADWPRAQDENAAYIVDELILARFKDGRFSEGAREGVVGIDAMARGLALPSPYLPSWVFAALVAVGFISICVGLSFLKDGRKGFGWAFILLAIAIMSYILQSLYESSFGDGMGDGGFSDGGGAGGGW